MSDSSSVNIPLLAARKLCPVCGKVSYSAGGIHPQCAAKRADVPPDRPRGAKDKPAATKPAPRRSWSKPCPKCKTEVHVRVGKCACGHVFQTSAGAAKR
jgi:hypothetical protein